MRADTDKVGWGDKTVTVDVERGDHTGDAKDAYARWENDSYWLLAPLKLKDAGVNLSYHGQQEVEGKSYWVLHLGFDVVGLTPSDQYNLYIDRETNLLRYRGYMPTLDKSVRGTWDAYREFGGLPLSAEHAFGDLRICFSDVAVETTP